MAHSDDYIVELRNELGPSFPEGSENTVEFWHILEANVRKDFGAFSKQMKLVQKHKKMHQGEVWEKGVLPVWAQEISLGENAIARKIGRLVWGAAIITTLLIVAYIIFLPTAPDGSFLSIFCIIFGAFEVRNFCIGKPTLFEHIWTEARLGHLTLRWLGLVGDIFVLVLGVLIIFNA